LPYDKNCVLVDKGYFSGCKVKEKGSELLRRPKILEKYLSKGEVTHHFSKNNLYVFFILFDFMSIIFPDLPFQIVKASQDNTYHFLI